MKSRQLVVILAFASLFGCANRPESIRASYVPIEKFEYMECDQLRTALIGVQGGLSDSSRKQNDKANADAVGVFLLGVPFSKLSGDHEGEIAQQKGEMEAIQGALAKRRCGQSAQGSVATGPGSAQAAQQRLEVLDGLKTRGFVSEEEYQSRRRQIIDQALDSKDPIAVARDPEPAGGTRVLTFRDLEPYSGAVLSQTSLRLTEMSPESVEFNSGALALSRGRLNVLRGSLPVPSIFDFQTSLLVPGSTFRARLSSTMSAPYDMPADVSGSVRQSSLGSDFVRIEVDGYSPTEVVPGTPQGARGARIEGHIELDRATGITVAGELRSLNPGFVLRREIVVAQTKK